MAKHRSTDDRTRLSLVRSYKGRHVDTARQPGNQDRVNTTPDEQYDDSSNDRGAGPRRG